MKVLILSTLYSHDLNAIIRTKNTIIIINIKHDFVKHKEQRYKENKIIFKCKRIIICTVT